MWKTEKTYSNYMFKPILKRLLLWLLRSMWSMVAKTVSTWTWLQHHPWNLSAAKQVQGKVKGTPSGVKKLAFRMELPIGTLKVRLGAPTHALPHGTPASRPLLQDPKVQFLVSLQWNSASTTHVWAQGLHIKWQFRLCKSPRNSASRRILDHS